MGGEGTPAEVLAHLMAALGTIPCPACGGAITVRHRGMTKQPGAQAVVLMLEAEPHTCPPPVPDGAEFVTCEVEP